MHPVMLTKVAHNLVGGLERLTEIGEEAKVPAAKIKVYT